MKVYTIHSFPFLFSSYKDEEMPSVTRALLEKQIISVEDELSEAKLEASKLKTELVSEKSASEIKLSEMQSRINEVSFFYSCL
jgi:mitofilin